MVIITCDNNGAYISPRRHAQLSLSRCHLRDIRYRFCERFEDLAFSPLPFLSLSFLPMIRARRQAVVDWHLTCIIARKNRHSLNGARPTSGWCHLFRSNLRFATKDSYFILKSVFIFRIYSPFLTLLRIFPERVRVPSLRFKINFRGLLTLNYFYYFIIVH